MNEAELLSKIKIQESGCWIWTGSSTRGYGRVWYSGIIQSTHILIYKLRKGEIPQGLELDHLCRNKLCCNPDHLDPVTHLENCRRSKQFSRNTQKTHCPRGHEYSKENTYYFPNRGGVYRRCKICHLAERKIQRDRALEKKGEKEHVRSR